MQSWDGIYLHVYGLECSALLLGMSYMVIKYLEGSKRPEAASPPPPHPVLLLWHLLRLWLSPDFYTGVLRSDDHP